MTGGQNQRSKKPRAYCIQQEGREPFSVTLCGRWAWALERLRDAGMNGITPMDQPAPRWAAYVHRLRHTYGILIDTVLERHGGEFPGRHARYVLRAKVTKGGME